VFAHPSDKIGKIKTNTIFKFMARKSGKTSISLNIEVLQAVDQIAEQQGGNRSDVINDILAAVLTSCRQDQVNHATEKQNIKLAEAVRRAFKMYILLNNSHDVTKYARRSRRTPEEFAQHLVDRGIMELKMYENDTIE
jgi:hypothetical protein